MPCIIAQRFSPVKWAARMLPLHHRPQWGQKRLERLPRASIGWHRR
jgi:hypothetical protein